MPLSSSSPLLADLGFELSRHKTLADRALAELSDEEFFARPAPVVNSPALIVKHLAGNLTSRWTDFLNTDGDKPTRDRDAEFVISPTDSRASLMAAWQRGWQALLDTVANLTEDDLDREITIRGEPHTVRQALLRGLTHAAYHVGQILYVARLLKPAATWQTIAPGQSRSHAADYRAGSK
ncbi:MAG: DinB family protein [Pirellulaceae bacterium]|nr:DinB family protein [Pirellulaceae bacterium]